jgi:hypothetical protein
MRYMRGGGNRQSFGTQRAVVDELGSAIDHRTGRPEAITLRGAARLAATVDSGQASEDVEQRPVDVARAVLLGPWSAELSDSGTTGGSACRPGH